MDALGGSVCYSDLAQYSDSSHDTVVRVDTVVDTVMIQWRYSGDTVKRVDRVVDTVEIQWRGWIGW